MSHLSLETIARLVEDAPNTDEAAHLDACVVCRGELDAMREDVHALGMLPDMAAAPDQWSDLERRLTDEGIIRTPAARRASWSTRMMQIAAALVLFLGGSLAGRMTMAPEVRTVTQVVPGETVEVHSSSEPESVAPAAAPTAQPVIDAPVPRASSSVMLASNPRSAGTVEEAAQVLRQAEELYLGALTRYAELASQSEAGDPVARLAALQSIILTTQAALNQTPTDPVINGYHLTALAQRDATLRQVAAASSDRWY